MKKLLLKIRDIVEIYTPMVTFSLLFIAFIVQVISRYLFNHPLTWTTDIIVTCFCWTVILGACYTMRERGHVQFTMLYDLYPARPAAFARLAGNLILIITLAILVVPSWRFANFQSFQRTAVLRINLRWVFLPFVYFLFSIIGYTLPLLKEDVLVLCGKLPDSREHASELDAKVRRK